MPHASAAYCRREVLVLLRHTIFLYGFSFVLCLAQVQAQLQVDLHLSSPSLQPGVSIAPLHSCDARNLSPALRWHYGPYGTRSFALVLRDPDAPGGTFIHWVLYNLPASTRSLPEGLSTTPQLPGGALQGTNDFGRTGYAGPCPPHGQSHRYIFTLYALDNDLRLSPGAHESDLIRAMQGHILATGQLMGRFQH